jgi:hypothetical protein
MASSNRKRKSQSDANTQHIRSFLKKGINAALSVNLVNVLSRTNISFLSRGDSLELFQKIMEYGSGKN